MPDDWWILFRIDIESAVLVTCQPPAFREVHDGLHEWEGTAEESFKIMFGFEEPLSAITLRVLKRRLAYLKPNYLQDAIAFQVGESELI